MVLVNANFENLEVLIVGRGNDSVRKRVSLYRSLNDKRVGESV